MINYCTLEKQHFHLLKISTWKRLLCRGTNCSVGEQIVLSLSNFMPVTRWVFAKRMAQQADQNIKFLDGFRICAKIVLIHKS